LFSIHFRFKLKTDRKVFAHNSMGCKRSTVKHMVNVKSGGVQVLTPVLALGMVKLHQLYIRIDLQSP